MMYSNMHTNSLIQRPQWSEIFSELKEYCYFYVHRHFHKGLCTLSNTYYSKKFQEISREIADALKTRMLIQK